MAADKKLEIQKEAFFEAIEQLAKQNLLEVKEIIEIISDSVIKSFHTKFDPDADLDFILDFDKKEIKLTNNTKYVVDEEVEDQYKSIEINIKDAKKINKNVKVGDTVSEEVDFTAYAKGISGRIKQMIIQSVREKRKQAIYTKHKGLKGEMVSAVVTSSAASHAILALEDGTIAFMPSKLKNPNIKLSVGERVDVYVEDVLEKSKDAQVIVSNGSKQIVRRILEVEVPEIAEGIVEITSMSRLPGFRTKVAVRSLSEGVDAVGALIGAQGSRIKTIIEKLDGEKLDVILWTNDSDSFIANAVSPAKVIAVINKKDEDGNDIEGHKIIITPNKHQTLAIGKKGTNARLAVELTSTRIDVLSIDEANQKKLEFTWNGNINEEQAALIEDGQRFDSRDSRPRRQNTSFQTKDLAFDGFDMDIQSFNENMSETELDDAELDQQIDDDLFSKEELDKFDKDFNFDETLADIDRDFLDE
ncbi:transcription termination factor NusA [Candidatus Mycoplasma mahonii]|uniref:transcription termination factor NusA n=1 Tax=Candidatus Mycoplasma mahonii TaxID=3004105 RepID=UPI0026EEF6FF|nr:transcription termination factor NusA [Candidatus Mycoplasma mahonii]WKX02535.1 transcription termination factor NusA [Candidatus Mycoplasma mahonii]